MPGCLPSICRRSKRIALRDDGGLDEVTVRLVEPAADRRRHDELLVETFVDPWRFGGTSYQAANWWARSSLTRYDVGASPGQRLGVSGRSWSKAMTAWPIESHRRDGTDAE